MPQRFGEKLKYLRQQLGLTQAELAQRLSLASHSHVSSLESGRHQPGLPLITNIMRLFNVSSLYLLDDRVNTADASAYINIGNRDDQAKMPFGERLRAARLRRGLSQRQFIQRLGLSSRSAVSDIESGRRLPSSALLTKIAEVLDVTTDELLRDSILCDVVPTATNGVD
jgi:transcriptional regulator with XRE-family HTH domain